MNKQQINDIKELTAWCSGTAYKFPDYAIFCDTHKGIAIYTHNTYLANFFFKSEKIYSKAKSIVKRAIRKSMTNK